MINHTRILATRQRAAKGDLQAMFRRMSDEIGGLLNRRAGFDGTIPLSRLREVRVSLAPMVMEYFVSSDGRNAFSENGLPLSPFATLLMQHIAVVTSDVVQAHTRWMQKNIPLDIQLWLQNGTRRIQEQQNRQVLVRYQPSTEWLDSRGYTLSDRIWQSGTETRRKLDLLLTEGIRDGISAVDLAKKIEGFLNPYQKNIRTKKPYGSDGSFNALRLTRSEITLAHSRAALVAAGANPFVVSMDYKLSPSHPKFDICDGFAANSPYPVEECPIPVEDTHPHCLCVVSPNVGDMQDIIEQLRQEIADGATAIVNPLSLRRFLVRLLGAAIVALFLSELEVV